MLEAVILGIIQGLTEFLPVSSSGHLILTQRAFGVREPSLFFDVLLHVATLIPVCIVFRRDIINLIRKPFQKTVLYLFVGTVPAVAAALLFGGLIDSSRELLWVLPITFTVTGCLLLFADWAVIRAERKGQAGKTTDGMTIVDAAFIGCAQAVGIPPGISRSGCTLAASLFRGLDRKEAAKFIFLLSVPAILGAAAKESLGLVKDGIVLDMGFVEMAAGFIAAALAGYISVNFMLTLIRKARLRYFSYYVFALALFILVDIFVLNGAVLS
jgi:undecaprenyl-diphosphatase